jgi:signal transduction histidine kinase
LQKCPDCGAPLFSIRSHRGSEVRWCTRRGCHYQAWDEIENAGDREYVEIEVRDNGAGMDSQTLSMIFEPFFTTKGTRGTGLGLAVSWGIVRNHGGNISVESEPGKGAVFTVRIPVEVLEG